MEKGRGLAQGGGGGWWRDNDDGALQRDDHALAQGLCSATVPVHLPIQHSLANHLQRRTRFMGARFPTYPLPLLTARIDGADWAVHMYALCRAHAQNTHTHDTYSYLPL